MRKTYQVTYTVYKVIEVDDKEMKEYGYEGYITDEMRNEYLQNLIEDEYDLGVPYDDIEIKEIDLNN